MICKFLSPRCLLKALFPDRTFVIVTERNTRKISIPWWLQVMFVVSLSSVIVFFALRYNRYKHYNNYAVILEENDNLKEEHKQMQVEFQKYNEKADKINEYLKVTDSANFDELHDNNKVYSKEEMANILEKKTRLAFNQIDVRKKYIANSVRKLGISNISYNRIVK